MCMPFQLGRGRGRGRDDRGGDLERAQSQPGIYIIWYAAPSPVNYGDMVYYTFHW